MAIERLNIEEKIQNQGRTTQGRLMASEVNEMVSKINELVRDRNRRIYLSEDEYEELLDQGTVTVDGVVIEFDEEDEYNVYEE